MNSLGLTSALTALAGAIASVLTVDEIVLLASVLVVLGDMLAAIAAFDAFDPDRNVCDKKKTV